MTWEQERVSTDAPIGVFDSGLGGLTVVREIRHLLPDVPILYVADQAHVPYGGRRLSEVCRLACGISESLSNAGCQAVVMACNISSAVARDVVQAAHPDFPVFGVIGPGAQAAVSSTRNGKIGVLATTGTVQSRAYSHTLHALDPALVVTEVACPAFVPLVESGQTDGPEACEIARAYLAPLLASDVDTVILGCTHYPFLLPTLRALAPHLVFVDPAQRTAQAVCTGISGKSWKLHPRVGGSAPEIENPCLDKASVLRTQDFASAGRLLFPAGSFQLPAQIAEPDRLLLATTGDVPAFAAQTRRFLPELANQARFAGTRWYDNRLCFDGF